MAVGQAPTSDHVVNADRSVSFRETIRRFSEALDRRCRFKVRPRRYYGTVWISDCYTDYANPALFRQFEGPLMEGQAMRTMGKGLSKDQVSAGALAEAIERLSLNLHLEENDGRVPVYRLTETADLEPVDLPDEMIARVNNSADGVSAGNTVNECILHGLFEMYEHFDVCRHLHRIGLDHRHFIDPLLTGFDPLVASKMLAVAVPGEHSKLTTVHAVVCPKDLGPYVRTCTHLDGYLALQRAFNETVQSHKTRSVHDLQTYAVEPDIFEVENHHGDDVKENILTILADIDEPVYVQDWTDPVMQVPVLRPFTERLLALKTGEETVSAYVQQIMDDSTRYIAW